MARSVDLTLINSHVNLKIVIPSTQLQCCSNVTLWIHILKLKRRNVTNVDMKHSPIHFSNVIQTLFTQNSSNVHFAILFPKSLLTLNNIPKLVDLMSQCFLVTSVTTTVCLAKKPSKTILAKIRT